MHAIAPTQMETAHARARENRRVQFWELPYGMAGLYAELPAPDAVTVWNTLNLIARRPPKVHTSPESSDTESSGPADLARPGIEARRADALVELAQRFLAAPNAPTPQGRPAELQVSIDLPTLLGVRQDGIAELIGYGPIPMSIARELAGDAHWRRLVTDPIDGHLLDYDTTTYTPPRRLRDYVMARDRTCRMIGCRTPAHRTDLEHTIAHRTEPNPGSGSGSGPGSDPTETAATTGGSTSAANLGALCRRHHRLKTLGHWHLTSHPDGSATWTTPTGHTYQVTSGSSP